MLQAKYVSDYLYRIGTVENKNRILATMAYRQGSDTCVIEIFGEDGAVDHKEYPNFKDTKGQKWQDVFVPATPGYNWALRTVRNRLRELKFI